MDAVTMNLESFSIRRPRHSWRPSVVPQSDQSSSHLRQVPMPLRIADTHSKIVEDWNSFATVPEEDGSSSPSEIELDTLTEQYVAYMIPASFFAPSSTPWTPPVQHIHHHGKFGKVWSFALQIYIPAPNGTHDTHVPEEVSIGPKENILECMHPVILPWRRQICVCKKWLRQRISVYSNARAKRTCLDLARTRCSTVKAICTDISIPILINSAVENLVGHKALLAWENGAGSSKTWRRCSRVKLSDSRVLVILRCNDQPFYKSPLWLPQAFIRSPKRQRHNDRKRTLVSVGRARRLDKHFEPPLLCVEEDKQDCEPYTSQRTLTRIQERIPADLGDTGLPAAYMRLMWGNGSTLNGQLDRFLPEGLILQSHWRVSSFLRNDSHADVYVVTDIHHQHGPSPELELHSFLTDLSGNSVTYAKRKQERMYKSDHCLTRFWYGERRMLVVRLPKPVTPYRLQMEDFPKLKGIVSRTRTQFRYPHWFSSIPTYAEVLGTTNHDPQSPPLSQQMKEEEARILEQINEKVREKKSKKQRDKRRSERLVRKLAQQVPV